MTQEKGSREAEGRHGWRQEEDRREAVGRLEEVSLKARGRQEGGRRKV